MIKSKALLALALTICLTRSVCSYADVEVLTDPHQDMTIQQPSQKVFKLKDALDQLVFVSPEIAEAHQKVETFLLQAQMKPEEIATPLNWNITFFEVPGYMILEEMRKFTFGRYDGLVIKTVAEAKARLETDNYNIVCLETKNDLKRLYIESVINDNYLKVLKDNKDWFQSAQKDGEALVNNNLILPSDYLEIQNYSKEIEAQIQARSLKATIYKQNLGQIIDEKKVELSPEGALETNPYQFDPNKLGSYMKNHPEIQKNTDLFAVLRSEHVYKKLTEKLGIEQYLSITIRRVVFEGPYILIKDPSISAFANLFKDPNGKVKKQIFESEIKTADLQMKSSLMDFMVRARTQYYEVNQSYQDLQVSKNNLEYSKRVFFEKQELYKANLIKLTDLVEAKAALYKSELDYLSRLEQYNLDISDLQYYVGQYD